MKEISFKRWMIAISVNLVLCIGCLFIYKILDVKNAKDVFTCLCNSFFASGFIVLAFGLLTWCSNRGAFIGLTYSFHQIFEKRRFEEGFSKREKYADYRERKLKKQNGFLHLVIVGASFILLSLLFFIFV